MYFGPYSLFYAKNLVTAVQMAGESATTTHSNPICVGACRLYASMIVKAVNGASKPEILDFSRKKLPLYSAKVLGIDYKCFLGRWGRVRRAVAGSRALWA